MSETVHGVVKCQRTSGFLYDPARSFEPSYEDPWISPQFIHDYRLVDGAEIIGTIIESEKGWQLESIETICGLSPLDFKMRKRFDQLIPISPNERIRLGDGGNKSMRIIELIAPIGKGTRGMIVAPPKTGKTQILEEIANAVYETEPDTRILVLLIDERPEEVTHFRRSVKAEVLASSNDQSIQQHVNLAELALAHIRCELECGRDIVVLVDSLTRLGRAFNLHSPGTKRTLSGGLDAKALEIPRRFFGLARNIENGGSVTVIASAMIETGSRMDEYIFEEFKGTGNSEVVLDRTLAEARMFPAINLSASGTRREELLYNADDMKWLAALRRQLTDVDTKDAMQAMLKLIEMAPNNDKLLHSGIVDW